MLHDIITTLITGTCETLLLATSACLMGLLLGATLFFIWNHNKNLFIKRIILCVSVIIRSLPEILILFFIYFGISSVFFRLFYIEVEIPSFLAGVLALSIVFSAYAFKLFQAASLQIKQGEIEAARLLELSCTQIFFLIIAPQIYQRTLPGLENLWLILLKDTVLISLIGGYELMYRTQILISNTQEPFKYYILISCVYLGLSFISEKCFKKVKAYD
jgi:arginine transport system permease protein